MIDFFDHLYASIENRNQILKKLKYYSFLRFIVRLGANILIPIYLNLTQGNKKYTIASEIKQEELIIVSFTSFPARINRIWIIVESILRQKRKPNMLILWLSSEQFSDISLLPKRLLQLQNRGLSIRLCSDDLKSHKKYFYAMQEFPNDIVITIDDDVIYNSDLLLNLVEVNNKYPSAICCNHASRIVIKNGEIAPYLSWDNKVTEEKPNSEVMPIGVGAVLYPPYSLDNDVFNIDIFKKYCFQADDIWLNIMARLKGTLVVYTGFKSAYLPVINKNNKTLNASNIDEGLNDLQIKSIREFYINNRGIDPFKTLISRIKK